MKILVGTHHKTGTVWMAQTFAEIAKMLDVTFVDLANDTHKGEDGIFFDMFSRFDSNLRSGSYRGLHLIRDPRDIVISGLHYHLIATEKWLAEPRQEFGNLSYQSKLLSLSQEERFLFEMDNAARDTIEQILAWRYDDPRFFEARYEQLISDRQGLFFATILEHLGLDRRAVLSATKVFQHYSLAGKVRPRNDPHIRSGRRGQWKTEWRRWHGERFLEMFSDCLVRLGYEPNDNWIGALPS